MSGEEVPEGTTEAPLVRLTVNLNRSTAEALKEISVAKGITYTEAVRRAISVLKFIEDQTHEGRVILTMNGDGTGKKELVMM